MNETAISVCIPTYERVDYLKRLLDSLRNQTYKQFEVIITDDSKTDIVRSFISSYDSSYKIYYYKNSPSLGTAKNMVEGRKYANFEWIKLIHDDDFFESDKSLERYASSIVKDVNFIFSGYNFYLEDTKKLINKTISQKKFFKLSNDPAILFANNLIGAPSVMLFRKNIKYFFEPNLKWFTDIDYYIRILQNEKAIYIDQPLVNISFNDSQITSYTRLNPSIVVPETLYILNKFGHNLGNNILIYDSIWRMLRNMNIRSINALKEYSGDYTIPYFIKKMIDHQSIISHNIVRFGLFSKLAMGTSYILNNKINN